MQNIQTQFTTAQKVTFLSQPSSYPDRPSQVETHETHMSWVFLTDTYAYKLKKPVRTDFLDFSTPDARHHDCQEEVRLNRRLAPWVYLGVVALGVDSMGQLQLGGTDATIDWLVKMYRLPDDGMLDYAIKQGTVNAAEVKPVAQRLTQFYQSLPAIALSPTEYRRTLEDDIRATGQVLGETGDRLPAQAITFLITQQLDILNTEPEQFDHRIYHHHIVEGHGDLRPQHICLKPDIAIIDCLEFNRSLRILDPVDELAFLGLECDRLGAAWVGDWFLDTYYEGTGDRPPQQLVQFYKTYRACLRAKLAIWHTKEPGKNGIDHWIDRAHTYLRLAQHYVPRASD